MRYPALLLGLVLLLADRDLAAQEADGEAIYRKECKSCHGLKGVPPARERAKYKKLKAFAEDGFVAELSVDSIVTILTNGIDKNMKSFAKKLTEPEMQAVAGYTKRLAEGRKEDS